MKHVLSVVLALGLLSLTAQAQTITFLPKPQQPCRWVPDKSGIPDPSKPMLVLSCLK